MSPGCWSPHPQAHRHTREPQPSQWRAVLTPAVCPRPLGLPPHRALKGTALPGVEGGTSRGPGSSTSCRCPQKCLWPVLVSFSAGWAQAGWGLWTPGRAEVLTSPRSPSKGHQVPGQLSKVCPQSWQATHHVHPEGLLCHRCRGLCSSPSLTQQASHDTGQAGLQDKPATSCRPPLQLGPGSGRGDPQGPSGLPPGP